MFHRGSCLVSCHQSQNAPWHWSMRLIIFNNTVAFLQACKIFTARNLNSVVIGEEVQAEIHSTLMNPLQSSILTHELQYYPSATWSLCFSKFLRAIRRSALRRRHPFTHCGRISDCGLALKWIMWDQCMSMRVCMHHMGTTMQLLQSMHKHGLETT